MKFYRACAKCCKVYQYKDASGKNFGTKNMIDHTKKCTGVGASQMQLRQCFQHMLTSNDLSLMKRRQVEYCVDGYHSFRSVEHSGLKNLMQTCVDMGY